ncbi:ABC transporter substrate-binding protein [Shewanella nanhaiensis]|uniref:ABC transporter substrate-binding protein n=1 Tax=Shewanella nanhaiensis TaxID=2864872 RepID=A0ABS7E0A2_9GAMM|nr:ABC transporter substrate-binding protein [Shewanella nanhaiensis]MBW8183049.1 ABC transporter substrate-binding protein [Shewanella nanhaiensis]
MPLDRSSTFWENIVKHMELAAKQLNISLDVHYISQLERKRFSYSEYLDTVITNSEKPDYLITPFFKGIEQSLLSKVTEERISLFTFNIPLSPEFIAKFGFPREKFPYWIGHISPDEVDAGFQLADQLITLAASRSQLGVIKLLAVNGDRTGVVGQLREKGLMKRLALSPDVELLQLVDAKWMPGKAQYMASRLVRRHQNIDLFWTASDHIAMAVVNALEGYETQREKAIVGSIDWTKEIESYIESRSVGVSFGGHIFEGAWILPLLYDHFNHQDFAKELTSVISYKMQSITAKNSVLLKADNIKKIDFSYLSQCFTGKDNAYRFSPLKQLIQYGF